jgi:hypothetical protein
MYLLHNIEPDGSSQNRWERKRRRGLYQVGEFIVRARTINKKLPPERERTFTVGLNAIADGLDVLKKVALMSKLEFAST